MDAFASNEDLNGFVERDLSVGEELIPTDMNVVIFLHNTPSSGVGVHNGRVVYNRAQAGALIAVNYVELRDRGLNNAEAARIAYWRFLCAQAGLISPDWRTGDLSVRYIEAIRRPDNYDLAAALNAINDMDINSVLTDEYKVLSRGYFSDIVCTMAYVFRSRAHHYKPEFEELYARVLNKCNIDIRNVQLTQQQLFRSALHCIPPIVLDTFWLNRVSTGTCSGPLVKRVNVAAAGTAAFYAIRSALVDLGTVLPKLIEKHQTAVNRVNDLVEHFVETRWNGSINAKYYGVEREMPDESIYAGLIATVLGALDSFAPNSTLRASPSLQRVGNNAPLTAAVIGQTLRTIVRSEKFAENYLESGHVK